MVSQNLGAGNHDRVKKSLFWGLMLNWTVCVVISLFMFFGSNPALRLFLSSSDELALYYGNSYIRLISVFYIFCFTGSAYMGYFKGQGYMVIAFCGTTLHIIFRAICSAIMIGKMGLTAVALFSGLGWILCVTFLTINFIRIAGKNANIPFSHDRAGRRANSELKGLYNTVAVAESYHFPLHSPSYSAIMFNILINI